MHIQKKNSLAALLCAPDAACRIYDVQAPLTPSISTVHAAVSLISVRHKSILFAEADAFFAQSKKESACTCSRHIPEKKIHIAKRPHKIRFFLFCTKINSMLHYIAKSPEGQQVFP